jgi:leader peptidase (prepilin peptidase)/N-methyltransferase
LNCALYRFKIKKPVTGSSFCPHCKHDLSAFDLIPLFSFLTLGGKCRYCGQKISWQYPIVEFLTGIIFLQSFIFLSPKSSIDYLLLTLVLICFSLLVFIFVYDLKYFIIPNEIIYPAIGTALLWVGLRSFLESDFSILTNHLSAGFSVFAFFFLIFWLSRGKGIGFGDVRYALFLGFFLGFPDSLVALFFSFTIGAVVGLFFILTKKKSRKDMLPFAPFLVIGTYLAFFYGREIINWYLNFYL